MYVPNQKTVLGVLVCIGLYWFASVSTIFLLYYGHVLAVMYVLFFCFFYFNSILMAPISFLKYKSRWSIIVRDISLIPEQSLKIQMVHTEAVNRRTKQNR